MLGLLVPTDGRWAREAAGDLDALLRDHAHCEMKAATYAMSLVVRYPNDLGLVRKLTAIAQEELQHFDQVVAWLAHRGVALGPPPVDAYAAQLAALRTHSLADRLLVAALIEARSCERFKLLADELGEAHELHAFYRGLFEVEARHYRDYVSLAEALSPTAKERLAVLARAEADIVRACARPEGPRAVHG